MKATKIFKSISLIVYQKSFTLIMIYATIIVYRVLSQLLMIGHLLYHHFNVATFCKGGQITKPIIVVKYPVNYCMPFK